MSDSSVRYEVRDIRYGPIALFALLVALLTAATIWGWYGTVDMDRTDGPAVSPALREEPGPVTSSLPRLAEKPFDELPKVRAENGGRINVYAWSGAKGQSPARIPIERAMEHMARQGFELPAPEESTR